MDDEIAASTGTDPVQIDESDYSDAAFWARVAQDFSVSDYFRLNPVSLQSPAALASKDVAQACLEKWGLQVEADEALIATLYIQDPGIFPAPQRANVVHSMTLTQALLRNWQRNGSGDWFDHLGHLQPHNPMGFHTHLVNEALAPYDCVAYEAIYRKTSPQRYDATTQLAVSATAFKQYIWQHNLQAGYLAYLKLFWQAHAEDYNLMLKAGLFRAAWLQAEENTLDDEHKVMVLEALGLPLDQGWTELSFTDFVEAPISSTVTISELIVYGYRAVDIMVIRRTGSPTVLLYIPGNSSPIHAFKNANALKDWIAQLCRDPVKHRAFEAHFSAADDVDGLFYSGLSTTLEGFAVYPALLNAATGTWNPRALVQFGEPLSPWPFSHFRHRIKATSEADARQKIHSHSDYWKEEVSSGLSECVSVLGAVAIVFPELMPVVAGLSLALVDLGADQVVNGRTLQERQIGLGRVTFGVLNALPFVTEGASSVEAGIEIEGIDEAGGGYAIEGASTNVEPPDEVGSVPIFRPEPPALRSLDVKMHRLLSALEAPRPMPEAVTAQEYGVYPVNGRHFIELHDRSFRVEWVSQEKQFRIRSAEDPRSWGPYIKTLDTGVWDLDLKLGLRGGDSFDGTRLPPIRDSDGMPDPVLPELPKIERQRWQPKVQVELPLDGVAIEHAPGHAGDSIKDRYYIQLDGKKTRVYYDADVACWQTDSAMAHPVWLDPRGEWQSGSLEAFRKVQTRLPQSHRYEIYSFPRLPQLPANARPVDRVIHYIWMGEKGPGNTLLDTIKGNIGIGKDLRLHLHIDIDDPQAEAQLFEAFAVHPTMRISRLKEEAFFGRFLNSENGEAFTYFRHSRNRNYAAASDILRYRLVDEYGGIYMDCDDKIAQSFADIPLAAGPHDVLLGRRLESESLNYIGPGNSHFASHPDNPVLKKVLKEIKVRFDREKQSNAAFFSSPRPVINRDTAALKAASMLRMKPYMARISALTGPQLFSDVLSEARPDYFDLLERAYTPVDEVLSVAYIDRLHEAVDFYFPFKAKAKIDAGSSNEW
ncbi:glycosyltransferase sugar-binding domain-conteining protein [Pseudomonas viridiflava]|uniref:dermonecrotic toxin domain-containing protein n=1 Tax=Pseudomonas viridiflava TaxID=33069 RepID=UPI0015E36D27|nr:DUF6543 domain-containing protein [Pseudomonas viridiflava]MBA1230262.1 glycosyltransferase sugar-binding domain-conteining protein [Pseudomonas viridiflava]